MLETIQVKKDTGKGNSRQYIRDTVGCSSAAFRCTRTYVANNLLGYYALYILTCIHAEEQERQHKTQYYYCELDGAASAAAVIL